MSLRNANLAVFALLALGGIPLPAAESARCASVPVPDARHISNGWNIPSEGYEWSMTNACSKEKSKMMSVPRLCRNVVAA